MTAPVKEAAWVDILTGQRLTEPTTSMRQTHEDQPPMRGADGSLREPRVHTRIRGAAGIDGQWTMLSGADEIKWRRYVRSLQDETR